jgi:hypothetical protein
VNASVFDPAYFDRLRDYVVAAGNEGIYVSVMFFEAFGLHLSLPPDNVEGHPFYAANNVNEIDIASINDYQVLPLDPHVQVHGLLPASPLVRLVAAGIFELGIGLVSSSLGVAGGELIFPTLVFAFGAPIKTPGTASLLISLPTVAVGVLRHRRLGSSRIAPTLLGPSRRWGWIRLSGRW